MQTKLLSLIAITAHGTQKLYDNYDTELYLSPLKYYSESYIIKTAKDRHSCTQFSNMHTIQ